MSVTTHSNAWSVWIATEIDRAPEAETDVEAVNQIGLIDVGEAASLALPSTRSDPFGRFRRVAAAGLIVLVATAFGISRPHAPVPVVEPAPTSTPEAPGIVIIPARNFDQPDPMLVTAAGQYHAYFSTAFLDKSHANVPELISTNGQWGNEIDALPRMPAWALDSRHHGQVWAPYVQQLHGQWLMYFAATLKPPGPRLHCLGVARSSSATGPFVAVGTRPLECQKDQGGDIDVQPFEEIADG